MAFTKKTWKDRLVEYAGRRKITNVSTLAAQVVDVERAEGIVSEEGSAFNAANMNDLEQRVSDGFTSVQNSVNGVISDLSRVNVYVGADGKLHYVNKDGADSALPFSSVSDALFVQGNKISSETKSLSAGTYRLVYETACYSSAASCPTVSVYVNGVLRLSEKNIILSGSTDDSDYSLGADNKTLILPERSSVYLNISSGNWRPYATAVLFRIA